MKNSFFFSDDLADAAQGSYGSSSRMLLEAASPFSSLLVELVDKKVFFTHPHHFLWPLTWAWGWQYHGINRYGWTYFHTFRSCRIDKIYRKGTRTLKGYLDPDQRSFSQWQTYIICHRKKDPQLLWCQTFKDSYRGGLCNYHFYSVWYCLFNCAKSLLFVNVLIFFQQGLDEKIRGGGLNHRGNEGLPFDEMVPWPSWGTLWYEEALGSTGMSNPMSAWSVLLRGGCKGPVGEQQLFSLSWSCLFSSEADTEDIFSWFVISGVANLGSEEIERAAAPLTSTSPCDIFTLDKPDCELARDFCHYVALIINWTCVI